MKMLVEVEGLQVRFPVKTGALGRRGFVRAVDGVSFSIPQGTTLGLVGESGCGKSSTGRAILRLTEKSGGRVLFDGQDVHALSGKALRALRPQMQIVFQDPYSSLSPRLPIGELIGEGVREHGIVPKGEREAYVRAVMARCGLESWQRDRYPHEFSGGQRQRVGIARAIALKPRFIVCDEPVSALDVSVQAQIVNLLLDLQEGEGLTYLFISHDLAVVEQMADSLGVMYLGGIVEYGTREDLFRRRLHPYTQALFAAVPGGPADRAVLEGAPPSPVAEIRGCKFAGRCPRCRARCLETAPELREVFPGHFAACHLYG